jgi:hypothetical protein
MRRFGVAPVVYVRLHDPAGVINIVAVNTGAMIYILTEDLKATNRSAVPFATTGYARRCSSMSCAIKIGFLRS